VDREESWNPRQLTLSNPSHLPITLLATLTMQFRTATFSAIALYAVQGLAETHTVSFTNNCGRGTPTLVQNGNILSTGGAYTANGEFNSFIAYLQTGSCGLNGEGCTLVEGTLQNTGFSSADVSLVPPHTFSVTSGFGYYGGDGSCNTVGLDCTGPNCPCAFTDATNGCVIQCASDNINLAITFCD